MDLVLEVLDYAFLDKLYAKWLPKSLEENLPEAPAFVQQWAEIIDNGTKTAIEYTQKTKLHKLISKSLIDTPSSKLI